MNTKPKIIFMGTPEIAQTILQKLHESGYPILAVFAQPDMPCGRGQKMQSPPVAVYAKTHDLPLYQPEKIRNPETLSLIQSLQADYILVAAYGKILPEAVIKAARKEILNVHASLLPKYRGASPISQAILEGDALTGVTIIRIIPELDAGPIFFKKEVAIADSDTTLTLTQKLADLGAQALLETLELLETKPFSPVEQEHSQATFTKKLTKEASPIDWNQPAQMILNQIRALQPWPVAQTKIEQKLLKIYKGEVPKEKSGLPPGTVFHVSKKGWSVATATEDLLIEEVQLEGKKRMSAFDLANGLRLKVGTVLGN